MLPTFRTPKPPSAREIDAATAKAGPLIVGVDMASAGNSMCVARHNADGTLTILEMHQWKHDIDLEPNP